MTGREARYPFVEVQDYIGERIEGDDIVEFRLLYSGRLLGSSKQDTRADVKHALRREFHPQLRRLWKIHKGLLQWAEVNGRSSWGKHIFRSEPSEADKIDLGLERISQNWQMFGYKFIPLVTNELFLCCSLDILFLRPEEPRFLLNSGDLDSKVKTVFDALRVPNDLKECGGMGPQEDESPFFCLLRDDKLISEIKVTSDELLTLPKERDMKPNDAFLVIHVKLQPTTRTILKHIYE